MVGVTPIGGEAAARPQEPFHVPAAGGGVGGPTTSVKRFHLGDESRESDQFEDLELSVVRVLFRFDIAAR